MSNQDGRENAVQPGHLGWKDVALGACSLLLALGVTIVGLYARGVERDLERERVSNVKLWEFYHELNQRRAIIERDISDLREDLNEIRGKSRSAYRP